MRASVWISGFVAAFVLAVPSTAYADDDGGFTLKDPRITESSGLAASRAHPGVYWTHNDSDDGAYVYAVDSSTGGTVARITLQGVGTARDAEAISVGADGNVYVGDIGDNLGGTWDHVWIYRFPEPKTLEDAVVRATQFTVRYADGARDAEALMVHPKTGRVYIADKKEGGGGLYEGPAELSPSGGNVFRRIASTDLEVTDGAFSPDGTRLVLRGYFGGTEYAWDGASGKPGELLGDPDVPLRLSYPQGESVTFEGDGRSLLFGTEGEGSPVMRKELSGELLPESVGEPSSSGSSEKPGSGSGSSDGDSGEGNRNMATGLLVFAGVTAAFVGLRRLFKRSA